MITWWSKSRNRLREMNLSNWFLFSCSFIIIIIINIMIANTAAAITMKPSRALVYELFFFRIHAATMNKERWSGAIEYFLFLFTATSAPCDSYFENKKNEISNLRSTKTQLDWFLLLWKTTSHFESKSNKKK